jgi:hypothetical protein
LNLYDKSYLLNLNNQMHIHKPLCTLKYGLKSSILWKYDFVKLNLNYLIGLISMKTETKSVR